MKMIKIPGGGDTCKENFLGNLFFLEIFKQAQGVQKRDVKTLSFDRQLEAVPSRRLSKNAKHSDEEQNLKQSAQILTGGNKGCQILCFAQNFGRNLKSLVQSRSKIKAFTLAEVLITLAIIGVVAALTIPTVITNYQKKMYVTQLKKSYNNITNGFRTAMANDGVTKLSDTTLWSKMPSNGSDNGISAEDLVKTRGKDFKDEFLKTFKVAGVYDENNFPEAQTMHYKMLNGEEFEGVNFGIFLADGSWLYFDFDKNVRGASCGERKSCTSLREFQEINNTPTKFWEHIGEMWIDVNGAKGPNIVGRDLFVFWLGNDGMLYPWGGKDLAVYQGCSYDNLESCDVYWTNNSGTSCMPDSDGSGCAGRIMEENWQMNY